jgi:carboxypeptidase family protein
VRGTVRGADGKVVADAQIDFLGLPMVARSGSDGRYGLTGVPSGTQTLQVRAVGYAAQRLTLDLKTGERRQIDIGLARASAQALAPVTIVGKGTSLDRSGFADRKRTGVGQFFTEDEIARRGSFTTTHILYNARGAYILGGPDDLVQFRRPVGTGISQTGGVLSPSSPGGGVLSGAAAARLAKPSDVTANGYETRCYPAYFLDGFLVGGDARDVNILVRPYQIRGVEVYQDPATAPAEYRRPDIKCAIVLIWTKPLQGESTKAP